jgi:hypothetical protein
VVQRDTAFGIDLDTRERCLRARAEVLLHTGKAHAIAMARMRGLVLGLLLRAIGPQRMLARGFQHFVHANGPGGIAPCVFFMPERSAFFRRKSIGSSFNCSANSSTIISVAAMLCSVP